MSRATDARITAVEHGYQDFHYRTPLKFGGTPVDRVTLVNVECRDGHSYRDVSKYDLIFSNGLVQYLDSQMLEEHIANAATMMDGGSVLVCGSVPWRARRWDYYSGYLERPCAKRSAITYLKSLRRVLADSVGYWYDLADFCALGHRFGLSVEFFGSMVHLYRFHVAMKIRPT